MNKIYSLKIEKHVLGGLLRHPKIYADIERYISDKDFYNDVHKTIFSMIAATLLEGKRVDKVILAERIKNLGISFPDEIDIYSYIDNISFTQITNKATIEAAQELKKITIRRRATISQR
jgi:replicative DNA helicase